MHKITATTLNATPLPQTKPVETGDGKYCSGNSGNLKI